MCGIAGIWGTEDQSAVQNMIEKLTHRGPDAEGTFHSDGGSLGHRRLSIMDPTGGDQPIHSEDNTTVIIANGEIYNFKKLKKNLNGNHRFRTRSDSEIILHLYEERGIEMVRRLDGMFAFAMADSGELLLARDTVGIKPLYYGTRERNGSDPVLYFASELKALSELDCDVHEFPPGTCYSTSRGFVPFHRIPYHSPREMPLDIRLDILRKTLEESVVKRLMSDVPLGVYLSGGLDSSLIAALARRHMDEMHTFCVGIEGSRDIEAARLVSRHIGSIHHEHIFTPDDVMKELPKILYYLESFDQDLVRSGIPCYFCSRLASQHVKVILTGEGADELFAGYTYYKDIDDPETLGRELHRSITTLHNVNLQRVDRMTMAHGIEGRVPFLDLDLIEAAGTVPPELKMRRGPNGKKVEKWILRKVAEDLLPEEIVWRDKEQFDEGSGTVDVLKSTLEKFAQDSGAEEYLRTHARDRLRSTEEAFYHKTLRELFGDSRVILDNVGRWQDRDV